MPRTKTRTTAKDNKNAASKSSALTTQKVTANAEQKGLTLVVNSKPPKYQIGDELFYSLKVAQEYIDAYGVAAESKSEVVNVEASDLDINNVVEEVKTNNSDEEVEKVVDSVVVNLADEFEEDSSVERVDKEENIPVSEVVNADNIDSSLDKELPPEELDKEHTVEEEGILIRDAVVKLGMPEDQLRNLLEGVCEPGADSISIKMFNGIADFLRKKIKSEQGHSEENNESALTVGQKSELSDEPKGFDESRLQLNINLQSQVLNLNKIAKTLALVSADEVVEDFRQIYTHRVNHGINQITSEVAQQTIEAIDQLRASDNRDFLVGLGKEDSLERQEVQMKVDQLMDLI